MTDIFFEISALEWAEIIRNYALAVAAAVSAWLAWSGLRIWKEQQVWKDDRSLAKKILIEAFKIEQRIWNSRDPLTRDLFYMKYNQDVEHSEVSDLLPNRDIAYFQELSKKTREARANIESFLLEARAIWGEETSNLMKQLIDREAEQNRKALKFALLKQRERKSPASRLTDIFYEKLDKSESQMLRGVDANDEYDKETLELVTKIEISLKFMLDRRS